MDPIVRRLARLAWWGVLLSALAYALLHLLLVAALLTFGRVAGGYPLAAPAIAVYGVVAVAGTGLALWTSRRRRTAAERLEPLAALAVLLAGSVAGAFFATPILAGLGARVEYAPYLDDDGALALLNVGLALVVFVVALVGRRRRLLVAGMAAQGLALLLNPGLAVAAMRYGLPRDAYGLLVPPLIYLGGALALGWRVRGWAPDEASVRPSGPGQLAVAGMGLALVAGVWAVSWPYLGPVRGLGDSWLPEAGQTLGWVGRAVPQGAWGVAGAVLGALKAAFPWLVGAAALAWLAAASLKAARLGVWGTVRAIGFPGGLAIAGVAMLWHSPLPFVVYGANLPLVHGLAGALPGAIGQEWLGVWMYLGYALLGLALVGTSAGLRGCSVQRRSRLAFWATLLALLAAVAMTAGIWAGTVQSLQVQRLLSLPEYRQAAQLHLALSLPINAVLALAAWGTALAGLRAVAAGPAALSRAALGRRLALCGVVVAAGAAAF